MIGILGGMGTQAGLDFCNKLAMLSRGRIDQEYPIFILYNKSNIPGRPENLHKYNKVLEQLCRKVIQRRDNRLQIFHRLSLLRKQMSIFRFIQPSAANDQA